MLQFSGCNAQENKGGDNISKDSVLIIRDIYFTSWDANDIDRTNSRGALKSVVNFIANNEGVFEVGVHSDTRYQKNTSKNITLRKAQLIVDYLVSEGISREKLRAKGYSAKCPIIVNATSEQEHAVNRRVEIKLLAGQNP